MNKQTKLIHGSKQMENYGYIHRKKDFAEAYDRFARQNSSRNIFYVTLNGVAMPICSASI